MWKSEPSIAIRLTIKKLLDYIVAETFFISFRYVSIHSHRVVVRVVVGVVVAVMLGVDVWLCKQRSLQMVIFSCTLGD